MAITTIAGIEAGMMNNNTKQILMVQKATIANQLAGTLTSLWKATGFPGAGVTPTTSAVCDIATVGSIPWYIPPSGDVYIASVCSSNNFTGQSLFLMDRLAHQGNCVGNIITVQTVDLRLDYVASNFAERRGAANGSDVQWYLETYAQLGATGTTLTVNYTNQNDTGGTIAVTIPATLRPNRLLPLTPTNGDFIKRIDSCQLTASTTAAGGFGFTAVRHITDWTQLGSHTNEKLDWQRVGFPRLPDNVCLMLAGMSNTTSIGIVNARIELIQG